MITISLVGSQGFKVPMCVTGGNGPDAGRGTRQRKANGGLDVEDIVNIDVPNGIRIRGRSSVCMEQISSFGWDTVASSCDFLPCCDAWHTGLSP
jgi:hypothetical protein